MTRRPAPAAPSQTTSVALMTAPRAKPAAPFNIIRAMDDPRLFAPHFRGKSWDAWRAFLRALFALPMNDADIATYRACTGRSTPPSKAFTETALIVGRRGGKSRVLATIAVFLATFRDYTPHLAPGEVATVMVIAADRKQARAIFRYITGLLEAVPLLAPMVQSATDDQIELNNRVVIEIGTASFRVTRGYSFAAVLADEVAFWRVEENSANPDTEILRALRPGMSSIPGSILMLASSPYAKKGELYNAYRRHYGKDGARVLVWKAPTNVMNTRIDPDIIKEAYDEDPEAAKAEYGAEFRDDLADFVTREAVDAVTCWGRRELPPCAGITYAAFCDPSGGSSDSMTLAVGYLRDGEVGVLDAVLEIRAPFNPEEATAQCAEVLKRYHVTRVIGDRYAGEWPPTEFSKHGIEFEQSAKPKSDIYRDLLPLLNAGRVELLEHQRLSAQLVGLERRTSRSGKDSIDHSPGGHDDIINAVAGVLTLVDLDRRPPLVSRSHLLQNGEPAPLPPVVKGVFAVVTVDTKGSLAAVYAAMPLSGDIKLLIYDFDDAPVATSLFPDVFTKIEKIATITRAQFGAVRVFAPQSLIGPKTLERSGVMPIPREFTEDTGLLLRVAQRFGNGEVKLCAPALDRSRTSPLGGALDFRAGVLDDNPIRTAVIWTIALALEQG